MTALLISLVILALWLGGLGLWALGRWGLFMVYTHEPSWRLAVRLLWSWVLVLTGYLAVQSHGEAWIASVTGFVLIVTGLSALTTFAKHYALSRLVTRSKPGDLHIVKAKSAVSL